MEPSPADTPSAASAAVLRAADPRSVMVASDMHLHESDPALSTRFFALLDEALAQALGGDEPPALFLLGDLFEYWVGDDHLPDLAISMAERLAAFAAHGGRVFLMHGNRDFLLDVALPARPDVPRFSSRCGASLLPDPVTIEVAGQRIALSHGDGLCTDDTRYQQWRLLCRSPAWQQQFLSRPVAERLALAQSLRQQSMQAQAVTETISDVNPVAVDALMTRLSSGLLIHGHTHQPMLHRWRSATASGAAARDRLRWVLSDWAADPPRGDVLPITVAATQAAAASR
jgi:UDP-2,3-diacylglucosamine hydrolase